MTLGANVLVQTIQSPPPTPRVRPAHQPTGSSFEDHLSAGSSAFAISPTLRI